jgi:hypothetical protein
MKATRRCEKRCWTALRTTPGSSSCAASSSSIGTHSSVLGSLPMILIRVCVDFCTTRIKENTTDATSPVCSFRQRRCHRTASGRLRGVKASRGRWVAELRLELAEARYSLHPPRSRRAE